MKHNAKLFQACAGVEGFDKGPAFGLWQRGVRYVRDMIDTLSRYSVGWIDWNICLDLEGGPNFVNNRADSPIIINATSGEFYKQPMFYAMAHFSKFVTPGSVRINHEVTGITSNKVHVIAFKTKEGKRVVVIDNEDDFKDYDIQVKDQFRSLPVKYSVKKNSFVTLVWDKQ